MSKKVMILTPFYEPTIGGAETFCKLLANEARKENDDVFVVTCDQEQFIKKPFTGTGIREFFRVFPELYGKSKSFNSIYDTRRLLTGEYFFDVIHAQGMIAGLIAVLMKRKHGCQVFITLLALYDFDKKPAWFRWACAWVLRQADIVFVEGEQGNKDIKPLGIIGVPFTHWVEDRFFTPIVDRDDLHVMFIGRDMPIKGKAIIEETEYIVRKKKEIKFGYHSDIPHDKLHKYLQCADILVVPSLYSEGYTRIVCEAAAAGCAVITSNNGSLPEQVKDFGISIAPIPKIFAYAIEALNEDRAGLKHMQEKAQKYAKEHFTADNAKVMIDEY